MTEEPQVLVVDDEEVPRESLALWLREEGFGVETAASGEEALAKARARTFDAYLVDLKLNPGPDGIEVMRRIRALRPDSAIVIITAYATVDTAVQAMKEGAQEYLVKPCNPAEISHLLKRTVRLRNLERENRFLRSRLLGTRTFQDLLSASPRMLEIFDLVKKVAGLKTTVLLEGESGTGKDLLARIIHSESNRAARPFVAVSCGALTETLLESEFFGHERGAFTGALAQKKGMFEVADGGTLFLDDIQDIPPKLQMDLLRVLQERRFFRVGGTHELTVDVRAIAAANRPLEEAVREGKFREDLYYRLAVVRIAIPPLRERREDIPLLASHFVERFSSEMGRPGVTLGEGALAALSAHSWPGNVRELENAVERALVTSEGKTLEAADFAFLNREAAGAEAWTPPPGLTLADLERGAVQAALDRSGGNVTRAARLLGIDRSTLYEKIKKFGIRR